MDDLLTPSEIEDRARLAGLSMRTVCVKAGIAQSTFWRWKNGDLNPSIEIYRRLCDATEPPDALPGGIPEGEGSL